MSSWMRAAGRLARNHTRNLFHAISGKPIQFVPLRSRTLDWEDVELARSWLGHRECWGGSGMVRRFEEEFAAWNGAPSAFAFESAGAALRACLQALGLALGDEIIIPAYSPPDLAAALAASGVRAAFCDIELETFGMSLDSLQEKITPQTRAVLVRHAFGLVSRDCAAIFELAASRGLRVIEDCTQAAGASLAGVKVGGWGGGGDGVGGRIEDGGRGRVDGRAAFFSGSREMAFNTIEGGVAVTGDEAAAARLGALSRDAALPPPEEIERQLSGVLLEHYRFKHSRRAWVGNWAELQYGGERGEGPARPEGADGAAAATLRRMADPIAALGIQQLHKLEHYNQRRRAGAARWDAWCDKQGLLRPRIIDGSVPVFLRYPVLVPPEKKLHPEWAREELGVELGVWYPDSPAIRAAAAGCPNASAAVERCVNFPTLLEDFRP